MSAVSALAAVRSPRSSSLLDALHDIVVVVRRNLLHIAREPLQLSDVTVQPVLFTLLFVYIFGSGIPVAGGSYADFAIAGLLLLNITTSSMGTALGVTVDIKTGIIDRFRTVPMWHAALLIGRSLTDILTATLCTGIVLLTGLVVGWRPQGGPLGLLEGVAVVLCFAYALNWASACAGLVAKGVESAQAFGFLALFPLAFVSNAMVPTRGMPGWLRAVADWNPVSAVTSAARSLWQNPNPSAADAAWPMQHPVAAALLWSALLLVVAVPLAVHLFRRRTTN